MLGSQIFPRRLLGLALGVRSDQSQSFLGQHVDLRHVGV